MFSSSSCCIMFLFLTAYRSNINCYNINWNWKTCIANKSLPDGYCLESKWERYVRTLAVQPGTIPCNSLTAEANSLTISSIHYAFQTLAIHLAFPIADARVLISPKKLANSYYADTIPFMAREQICHSGFFIAANWMILDVVYIQDDNQNCQRVAIEVTQVERPCASWKEEWLFRKECKTRAMESAI